MTEKGERDVQVLSRHDPDTAELLPLPALDLVEHVVGQAQREKEPESFIPAILPVEMCPIRGSFVAFHRKSSRRFR